MGTHTSHCAHGETEAQRSNMTSQSFTGQRQSGSLASNALPGSDPSPALAPKRVPESGVLTSWGASWLAAPSSWLPEGLLAWRILGLEQWSWGPVVALEVGLASSLPSLCNTGWKEVRSFVDTLTSGSQNVSEAMEPQPCVPPHRQEQEGHRQQEDGSI